MARDNSVKPYTMDELGEAVGHWQAAKNIKTTAERARDAKQKEIDSFQRDVDKADLEVQRFEATVRKILNNLEK